MLDNGSGPTFPGNCVKLYTDSLSGGVQERLRNFLSYRKQKNISYRKTARVNSYIKRTTTNRKNTPTNT